MCVGDVKLTWSFSAFTVLMYYAITNLCAIRMKPWERLYPIWLGVHRLGRVPYPGVLCGLGNLADRLRPDYLRVGLESVL